MADSLQSTTQAATAADAQNQQIQQAMAESFMALLNQVSSVAKSEINQ